MKQDKVLLTDHLYPTMEDFSPGGSGLFLDNSAPPHTQGTKARWKHGVMRTKIGQIKFNGKQISTERLWEILESSGHQLREYF